MEPSLDRRPDHRPIYWRFLLGGTQQLRLSRAAVTLLVIAGALLIPLGGLVTKLGGFDATLLCRRPLPLLIALPLAALMARWLGGRLAMLAGLVYLSSMPSLALAVPPAAAQSPIETPFCLAMLAAMALFALANVPGRLPLVAHVWTPGAFYSAVGVSLWLGGPAGPLLILATCVLYVTVSLDSRAVRFLTDPRGIAVLVACIAIDLGLAAWWPEARGQLFRTPGVAPGLKLLLPQVIGTLLLTGLPWTPLAAMAVALGIRRGHYATGIWRLLGCWLVAPAGLAMIGVLGDPPRLAVLLVPLSVFGAAGLASLALASRRRIRCIVSRRIVARPESSRPASRPLAPLH
jgi:hypothetical protein